jgi:hypothetical protein
MPSTSLEGRTPAGVRPILPRWKDGCFDAFMNALLDIDELVSPDHPFP